MAIMVPFVGKDMLVVASEAIDLEFNFFQSPDRYFREQLWHSFGFIVFRVELLLFLVSLAPVCLQLGFGVEVFHEICFQFVF